MLWLALHFPWLPIEALPLRQPPSAVVARGRVLIGDAEAAAAGIRPGQKLSTALGLHPGLAVFERHEARERQALESLACWAGRFTPTVSLAPPNELLLEIGGCLRLFGGIEPIVAAVTAGCVEQGYAPGWAAAPTPLGARWLARSGAGAILGESAGLQAALAALPCHIPGWPAEAVARLDSFGLRRLGDLRAMPGAGLRRRIGNRPVDDLARAWGDLPDPQQAFIFPECFACELELPSRVEHAEALLFSGQRLFSALAGWLHVRQRLVRRCTLRLKHDDGAPSELALNFAEPAADEGRFLRLLRERLGRLQLASPVEAVCLQADEVVDKQGSSVHLFDRAADGEGALACLERLRARLGERAVLALEAVADHRPECASCERDVVTGSDVQSRSAVPAGVATTQGKPGTPHRPLWLLPTPLALVERAGSPHWHGPLKLLSKPERLESGWWDEGEQGAAGDLRRDYFVARNPQGQWAWIFRDAEGWCLHGLFA
ncbi:DNA polymerase Y family protein [Dechloromonas sp. XY25]|uniref:DNA polymerase Y family protein n=1 Tax=Dechloromonas hankyongensis TaxID=2908002 RepID=A0ABS9K2V7_9RHOO|nr:DNA polymerase Y family protein [Dechloromonas hankyongensis]MCG2577514.1 DNA polymerase Y family protein [Dechloromonas hankyongensis]